MAPRWLGPGAIFLLAVLALGGLAIAHLGTLATSSRTGYDFGGFYIDDERAVYALSVAMRPGDRLLVRPELLGMFEPRLSTYEFYVVKGGDRYALLDGNGTSPVYLHVGNLTTRACCAHGDVTFDRPDDEAWRREGREPVQTGPGVHVEMRELELSVLDVPERIDLVWVFAYAEGFAPPENETQRRGLASQFETTLRAGDIGPASHQMPTVLGAAAVRVQPALYGLMAACAAGAAGAAVAWMLRLRTAGRGLDEAKGGTEGLLRLFGVAGAYLASLRDLLVASLVVTALVALHVALLGEPGPTLDLAERAGIAPGLRTVFHATLAILYAVVLAGWLYALWQVQRALSRWRRRSAAPPLDL